MPASIPGKSQRILINKKQPFQQVQQLPDVLKEEILKTKRERKVHYGECHLYQQIPRFPLSLMQVRKFKRNINLEINKEGLMLKLNCKNISTKIQDLALIKILLI